MRVAPFFYVLTCACPRNPFYDFVRVRYIPYLCTANSKSTIMAKRTYDLMLKGTVGYWNFNSQQVDDLLAKKANSQVKVLIDSLGGYLREGLSISSAFADHGEVHVFLRGMNASAATIATMGAKHIAIASSAMYLVHQGSYGVFEWGSLNADGFIQKAEEYKKTANDLQKMDLTVAQMFAKRCKKSVEEMLALMKEEKWLTAQEALEWGFVDEIIDDEEQPKLTASLATAMASAGIPVPQNMEVTPDGFLDQLKQLFAKVFPNSFTENQPKAEATAPDNNQPNNNSPMKKIFMCVAAVIAAASQEFEANAEGHFELTEANMDALEAKLKEHEDAAKAAQEAATKAKADHKTAIDEKDAKIAELEAQIAELNKLPGDTTAQVHGQQAGAEKPSAEAQAWQEAEDWFKNRK